MSNNTSSYLAVAFVLVALLGGVFGHVAFPNVVEVEKQIVVEKEVPVPVVVSNASENTDTINKIAEEILKEDKEESIAEGLALDELETKDFKKDLTDFLNDNNLSVESYKDIESIKVQDSDVSVDKKSAEVVVELKVSYLLDGDVDSEDIEKAKLEVVFTIDNLDEDEDYEDAEVDNYDFELIKVYD